MAYSAYDTIAIAKSYVGYLEKRDSGQLDSFTGNAGSSNYTIFWKYFDEKWTDFFNTKKQGSEWCDGFNDFCHVMASLKTGGTVDDARAVLCQPKKSAGAGCYYSVQYYRSAGRYSSTPQVGDQIFFSDSDGDPCHTGIVYAVDATYVYTIEGNTSGASGVVSNGGGVAMKSYRRNYSRIHGYGHPKYGTTVASVETSTAVQPTTKKLEYFSPYRTWKNGSTKEVVYRDTNLSLAIGSLSAYEQAWCMGRYGDAWLVLYKLDGYADNWTTGYVRYDGGLA